MKMLQGTFGRWGTLWWEMLQGETTEGDGKQMENSIAEVVGGDIALLKEMSNWQGRCPWGNVQGEHCRGHKVQVKQ